MRYDSKPAIWFSTCTLYQFIEDVPEENAMCKLVCRKVQCTEREWTTCRRRSLRFSGESMPERELDPSMGLSPYAREQTGREVLANAERNLSYSTRQ